MTEIRPADKCAVCGTNMMWHSLTIDKGPAVCAVDVQKWAGLLVCMKEDCVNGWDATQARMRWE